MPAHADLAEGQPGVESAGHLDARVDDPGAAGERRRLDPPLLLPGQHELLAIKKFLAFGVEARHEVVQPDLADGDQPRVVAVGGERPVQHFEVVRGDVSASRLRELDPSAIILSESNSLDESRSGISGFSRGSIGCPSCSVSHPRISVPA